MTRDHRDFQELLGAYALDAVDPDEAVELEEHLRSCPQCRAELADHRSVAALLANSGGPAPAGVWTRIAGALDDPAPPVAGETSVASPTDSLPDVAGSTAAAPSVPRSVPPTVAAADGTGVVPLDVGRRRGRGVATALAAAAAAVVLLAGAVGVLTIRDQEQRLDDLAAEVERTRDDRAAADALAVPGSTLVRLDAPDGDLAVRAVVTAEGQGYLLAGALPDAGDGATYQLWGLDGERAVSLGVLGRDPRIVPFHVEAPVDALAVTDEPEGGSDRPTSDPLVVGTLA